MPLLNSRMRTAINRLGDRRLSSNLDVVRAHGRSEKTSPFLSGGLPGVLGVRREDKNKWERRVPIAPRHVQQLVSQGLRVVVQPSNRRVFHDEEYRAAGAEVKEDLSECRAICAVKEVPVELLLPGRTWCFFSHTIKAQPAGMPLLDAILEKKIRLLDYECITSTGVRGGPRLVAFGEFAGCAGAIDFLRGLGERFLALGFSTPLLHIGSAFMYPSLDEAKRAVSMAGEAIRQNGLPLPLSPFTVVFTGTGNVTRGALEIFKLLPHEMVEPSKLPEICSRTGSRQLDSHKLFLSTARAEHMVRRRDGGKFDKAHYYAEPDHYEPTFQDSVLPYCTVLVNGMYWDARFPRLFTHEDLHRHVVSGRDRLLGVCDITCDADGSVPTRQFSSIEQPFYIFNALDEQVSTCLDGPGVLFHAVDHLPSELPREASEHFGDCLLPFLPALATERAPTSPRSDAEFSLSVLPEPVRGAIVAEGGALTKHYKYIQQLREVQARAETSGPEGDAVTAGDIFRPHGKLSALPAATTLELTGHLFDTKLINHITDLCESAKARLEILSLQVGSTVSNESFLSLSVHCHCDQEIIALIEDIKFASKKADVQFRQVGLAPGAESGRAETGITVSHPPGPRQNILVLGAGFVARPVVEYLARRPENMLTVASLHRPEVETLISSIPGIKAKGSLLPEVVDLAAAESGAPEAFAHLEALVRQSNLVISLAPASLHIGVARLALHHRVPLVTASYVSPAMQALDEEARSRQVLLLNEVGLDPGIDHMSAMKMIDAVRAAGKRILRFSSVCGGLTSPEAAGANPIGYKFSWSPRGALMAAQNSAKFMENGSPREIAGRDLMAYGRPLTINNALALEVLPNRDSTQFAELYGLEKIPSFFRGTLRYSGFSERMLALARLGLLDPNRRPELKAADMSWSRRRYLAEVMGAGSAAQALSEDPAALAAALRTRLLATSESSGTVAEAQAEAGLGFLDWMGFFEDAGLPCAVPLDQPLDVTASLLQREETAFQAGERDMVVMRHELDVESADGARHRHVATLIEYGLPHGATAMARTVGLTAAICSQLILDRPGCFGFGVLRPLSSECYEPVLKNLEAEGIRMEERVELLRKGRQTM